ncbi:uncharacterized protein METZ01_LOCUS463806, partial [marine metagenome]
VIARQALSPVPQVPADFEAYRPDRRQDGQMPATASRLPGFRSFWGRPEGVSTSCFRQKLVKGRGADAHRRRRCLVGTVNAGRSRSRASTQPVCDSVAHLPTGRSAPSTSSGTSGRVPRALGPEVRSLSPA